MLRALALSIVHETRDHGLRFFLLVLGFVAFSLVLGTRTGDHALPHAAVAVAIVAPFACTGLAATVVDDGASGFARLVAVQPAPRGAFALLRIGSSAAVLVALVLPAALALALVDAVQPLAAVGTAVLVVLWSAALSVLLGILFRGSAAATATWLVVCVANLLAVLATWRGMAMEDWLVRARHALPGSSAIEALVPGVDPWAWGAPVVLALEVALLAAAALASAASARGRALAGGALAIAVVLPFVLPPGGGAS